MFLILKWINCQKRSSFFLLFFLFCTFSQTAQNIKEVKNIKGIAFINGDVSPNQAKVTALNDAKINALRAAGIGENIKSYQLLFNSQNDGDFNQFFSSDIQSEIQGAVQNYSILSETTIQKNQLELVLEVIINATVIVYETKSDVSFDSNIEGIKSVYNNEEKLTFSLNSTKNAYLTIFCISDTESTLLFPNHYEKQFQILAKKEYHFPSKSMDYQLHTDMKKSETNKLIFVFTKTELPFIKMNSDQITTSEAIFNWIYSIMPDQRTVEYRSIVILK